MKILEKCPNSPWLSIFEWMKEHPDWVLEHWSGVRNNGWWQVRHKEAKSLFFIVDSRSARALSKRMKLIKQTDYRNWQYELLA